MVLAAPAAAQDLALLRDFVPGAYEAREVGQDWGARSLCLDRPVQLLFDGDPPAAKCEWTVLGDEATKAAVSYRCNGKRSGRTDLRRDAAGVYVVDAQGIAGALPFARKSEYRRTGACRAPAQ
ncbi:hypothetical protein [Sandaracinobacteroides saxicola]|uniref:DUF3617 family protein n=1 Tax=Sandaracinobacteroides saxicola TaxID=2759707 RepID=A0A7G5IJK5_9SPHN|nr:hypothetical protein [Sandaracinobacteroides saxicola]QMW23547.1 hypothetical protein H3309_03340 [Sandaracinobacteroides saxicola]